MLVKSYVKAAWLLKKARKKGPWYDDGVPILGLQKPTKC